MRRNHSFNFANVKVQGPSRIVNMVVQVLSREFNVMQSSPPLKNDRGDGVHQFLLVMEAHVQDNTETR